MQSQWVRLSILVCAAGLLTACSDSAGSDDSPQDTDGSSGRSEGDGPTQPGDDAVEPDGTTGGQTPDGPDSTDGGSETGTTPPDPGDPFDPPPSLPTLPDDVLESLAASINGILDGASVSGATQSVLIIDAETGQEVFAKNPGLLLAPASNTKLFTTGIAMDALGEDHRMTTEVRADGMPDADGLIPGDLHIVMHHDFTWSPQFQVSADLALDRMAEDLYELGLRTVGGAVVVHGEAVYNGQPFSTYNAAAHRTAVATTVASSLFGAGVTLSGGTTTADDFEQPGMLLHQWASLPLAVAIVPTNTVSHNEFADVLARHVGFELDGESSYSAEEGVLIEWLSSIETPVEGVAFNDGSGLSASNRVSAQTVVDMLDFMKDEPAGLAWVRSFAISGVRGTLSGRMQGADVWGRVWGKTGTLTGVIATSGVLFHRHDGRRYLVSLLFNGVGSNTFARAAHDNIFAIMGADHHGTTRPEAPVLTSVRAADSDVIEIAWSAVDDATGYLVWLSPDGKVWDREQARLVEGTEHRAGEIGFGQDVFVRVTAVGEGGESDASDVYGASAQPGLGRVLVVDGFDRWQAEPIVDNPLGGSHDFVVAHGAAIGGAVVWDSCDNDAVIAGDVSLDAYDAVVWLLGEESTVNETFDATEQQLVADYLSGGGNLMVSGAEIGWDLAGNGDPIDAEFFEDVLHAEYIGDESGAWFLDGVSGPFADVGAVGLYTPGTMTAAFTDQLEPGPGAESVAAYYGGFGGTAAISYDGDHRVLVLGFPFSVIDNAESRASVMSGALEIFGL
ncbi:MAG: D-alanyl-D-alanine carboxypeptidase [Nannocystaceae bacterium]|nr:D-alanyl-D-alanine carboxypeptidase [Nannocystaceae bacterium]